MSTASKGLAIVGGVLTVAVLSVALTVRLIASAIVSNLED